MNFANSRQNFANSKSSYAKSRSSMLYEYKALLSRVLLSQIQFS